MTTATDIEKLITQSEWWTRAANTHDRHYPEHEPVSVVDHLLAVARNVHRTLVEPEPLPYSAELRDTLQSQDVDPLEAA